jgi:hypothetical protein
MTIGELFSAHKQKMRACDTCEFGDITYWCCFDARRGDFDITRNRSLTDFGTDVTTCEQNAE